MKTIFQKTIWLFVVSVVWVSCSKDNENKGDKEHGEYLHMRIDGTAWQTDDSFQVKFVEQGLGVDDNTDSYHVLLSAMQSGDKEVFQILLRLPWDKIDNPTGSYPISSDASQSGMMPGTAEINYSQATSEIIFSSRTDSKGSPAVGTLTITEFEKGDGVFAQRQINWLKGTFSATLKATKQGYKTGEIREITDGEFEMPNALINLGK